MRYQCVFVTDARTVERIESAEFADDPQARQWAEGLAAGCIGPVAIELWAPPRLVERYAVIELAKVATAAPRRRPWGDWLRRVAAFLRGPDQARPR